jgi:glutamate formiminotransferase
MKIPMPVNMNIATNIISIARTDEEGIRAVRDIGWQLSGRAEIAGLY